MSEEARFYGHTKTGQPVYEYTLNSAAGITLKALNYGGVITAIEVPVSSGERVNVVLALDSIEAYEENPNYIGSLIGRYGGRLKTPIALGDEKHYLSANDRGNCLHGGFEGFGKKIWRAEVQKEDRAETLHLKYMSRDGEEGFPGNLMVHISYRLWKDGRVQIVYRAISDEDTVIGITHHSYFNLNPQQLDNLEHYLRVDATHLQLTGENQLPLETLFSLEGHEVTSEAGMRLVDLNRFVKNEFNDDKGIDHPFHIDGKPKELRRAATLWNVENKLSLTVETDCPAVVIYGGGWLGEEIPLLDKRCARAHGGICFETQEIPNAPSLFEESEYVLRKGDLYHRTSVWTFDTI